MEIFIVLERPAIVQDLSISLIPLSGVPSPWIRMDVAIGAYSDKSHIVLQVSGVFELPFYLACDLKHSECMLLPHISKVTLRS